MFEATLPAMPRLLTALAEWMSCIVIIMLMERRWSKKITVVLHLFFGMVMIQLHYCAYTVTSIEGVSREVQFYKWLLGMTVCMFMMLFYIRICTRGSFHMAVGGWSIAFVAAEFAASAEWQVSSALLTSRSMKDESVIVVMVCVFAVMFAGVYYGEKKIYDSLKQIDWGQSVILALLALLAMVISNVGFQKLVWQEQESLQITLSSIRTLVDFGALASMYLIQRLHLEHEMQMEMISINHMLDLQYRQYRDYKVNSEYISRQCHDLKHQIEAVRTACSKDEREQYLSEMEDAVQNYNAQNVTGNPVLDTILTQKKIFCAQNKIQLSCMADGRRLQQISVRDISIIFGNLIDNAIECVLQHEEEEDRLIQGEVYQKNEFLMIKFCNCFYGTLQYEKNLPITTKADKNSHGYGLRSVLYTVKKYHGTMKISAEKGWFTVKILLPLQTTDS